MSRKNWILIVLLAVLIGGLYYWIVKYSPKIDSDETILIEKIDSLSTKLDSIHRANDSIKIIIDTTEVRIEHVYEKYIQIRDRIVDQSTDADCIFFADYLSEDSKRFIDTINFRPAEAY
jgi:hypothetical protein